MLLTPPPKAPIDVNYALTVPQSLLFAELSLRGNLRQAFNTAMQIDYEPSYILIDNGAMSWNYDSDTAFDTAMLAEADAEQALYHFILTMETTARELDRVSQLLSPAELRRSQNIEDLADDLTVYWDAYSLHMTSLFTFWNMEHLVSEYLLNELQQANLNEEIQNGLNRFLAPNEPNYFLLERSLLGRIARRFELGRDSDQLGSTTLSDFERALQVHRDQFNFLLTPFNLGEPVSLSELLTRAGEVYAGSPSPSNSNMFRPIQAALGKLPPAIRRFARLTRRLTFWKSERLDALSLADTRTRSLLLDAAQAIKLDIQELVNMTSAEILESVRSGKAVISKNELQERAGGYCLCLHEGSIGLYEHGGSLSAVTLPQKALIGTQLKGTATSPGTVTGLARVLQEDSDYKNLRQGEVLITSMTRPEMGNALDRAVAFVTDQGGLLCHAAIISREMRKPCITDTTIATSIIKDGMLLEVNGSTGVVTILDSAH